MGPHCVLAHVGGCAISAMRRRALNSIASTSRVRVVRYGFSHDDRLLGMIEVEDTLRADAPALLEALRRQGLDVIILSGDRPVAVQAIAEPLGINWQAAMSPQGQG